MVAAAALLALASLAGAAPTYVTIPPQRCDLQNVPHDPGRSTRIAVALFGLVRHNCTMANFERFLVAPLLAHRGHQYTMDVFLHANVVAKITNARTNEDHEVLPGYVDWARFAPCRYTLEDQDVLDIKLARLRRRVVEHGKDFYGDNGDSIKNLLRALYSLKQSAHLVEARELELQRRYHTVVSVRVDTIFTREVPGAIYEYVRRSPVAKLFIPHFGCSINGDLLIEVLRPALAVDAHRRARRAPQRRVDDAEQRRVRLLVARGAAGDDVVPAARVDAHGAVRRRGEADFRRGVVESAERPARRRVVQEGPEAVLGRRPRPLDGR